MPVKENLEDKIHETKLKMKEISINLEHLDHTYQQLLKELAMTSEEVIAYTDNPDNFSPPIWEELQNEKKKLDEKLDLELSHLRDPLQAKKSYSERGTIQQHWIFVR